MLRSSKFVITRERKKRGVRLNVVRGCLERVVGLGISCKVAVGVVVGCGGESQVERLEFKGLNDEEKKAMRKGEVRVTFNYSFLLSYCWNLLMI